MALAPSSVNVFAPKTDPDAAPWLTRLLAANVSVLKLGDEVLEVTPSNTGPYRSIAPSLAKRIASACPKADSSEESI